MCVLHLLLACFDLCAFSEHTASMASHQRLLCLFACALQLQKWGLQVICKHILSPSSLVLCSALFLSSFLCFIHALVWSTPRAFIYVYFPLLFLEFSFLHFIFSLAAIHSFSLALLVYILFSPLLIPPSFLTSITLLLPPPTLALQMNSEEEIALPASAVISWSD